MGWNVSRPDYKASGFWKSVLSVKGDFDSWICFRVNDVQRVKFWHDEWCRQMKLHNQFTNLYVLDQRQQEALVAENFCYLGGAVVWDFSFR